MSITYPTSLDNFPNPQSTDLLDNSSPTLDHWTQHANVNDAIEALEAKVGVDSSAVTTSFDYKLSEVISTDKAVGKTATQTITNKTLGSGTKVTIGSDADGDMYYRESDGSLTRIPIGTSTYILTSDGSTPSWQANAAGSDASTTVKGVSELATYAETTARTTTGGTGAKLVVTPDNLTTVLTYDYQTDSVGTDAYAITCTPAPTAYTTGMRFTFKAGTANTGGATLDVNSLGAKTIKLQGRDLYTGEIVANQIVEVVYDGTNLNMVSEPATYALSQSTFEAVTSSNTRTSNTTSRNYTTAQSTYTKMKEILYNDVAGTVSVSYEIGDFSGSGVFTNYSRVYINGVATGTEHTDNTGIYTETFTLATGDLVQIYTKVVLTSGSASWNAKNMYLKYDKQLKQTFITNTNNS